jgi:hypothetical protein
VIDKLAFKSEIGLVGGSEVVFDGVENVGLDVFLFLEYQGGFGHQSSVHVLLDVFLSLGFLDL